MRNKLFSVVVVLGVLFAGMLAPAAWADSHGSITGIQWQWAQLTETEPASQSVVPDPENYVLVLNDDGSANIQADCNQVQWTYTLDDTSLTFNTLGPSTLAFCGDDSLDQLFLGKMGLGGTVRVEDERLVLELNESAGRIVFDNGGPAQTVPEELPDTGGALLVSPWAATVLGGLAALVTGLALRRKEE